MTKAEQIIRSALPRIKLKSLAELAERTGIPRSTLSDKMRYPCKLTARELRLIAEKLRLTAEEIQGIIMST